MATLLLQLERASFAIARTSGAKSRGAQIAKARDDSAGAAETDVDGGSRRVEAGATSEHAGRRAVAEVAAANQRTRKTTYGALSKAGEIAPEAGRPLIAAVRQRVPVGDPLI